MKIRRGNSAAIIAFVVLFGTVSTPAVAKGVETVIHGEPDAPARIGKCGVFHGDYQWTFRVDFVNDGATPLQAVKVRLETQDAFGSTLQTNDVSPTGTFSKNAHIEKAWSIGALYMPGSANVAKVRCSIVQTLATDGTVWKSPDADNPLNPGK